MSDSTQPELCEVCGAPLLAGSAGARCDICMLLAPPAREESGDYELIEEIGRGAFGVVYRAWQRSAEREVAMKVVTAPLPATADSIARFRDGAASAARLDHPNLVPVYEVGEFATQLFYSMRLVPGGRNIAMWARDLPPAKCFQAIALAMSEVARAVAFAHEQGVLHGDLKPSNILIDEADEPQLTDFGLASLRDADGVPLSPTGRAPEQAAGQEPTAASDVYGLGAVLFELLAGHPPMDEAAPLHDVPAELAALCGKCLSKDPGDRCPSALALAEGLEHFARRTPATEPVAEPVAPPVTDAPRPETAIPAWLVAACLALVAALAVVLWQGRQASEPAPTLATAPAPVSDWREYETVLDDAAAPRALTSLAARLRADPQSTQAATYALSILEHHPFAIPAGPAVDIPADAPSVQPALSPDGNHAAHATTDHGVRVFALATGADACPTLDAGGEVIALAFSPDGSHLAAGCQDGAIVLWQMPAGKRVSRTVTPATPLRDFVFSADGRMLALAGGDLVASGSLADFLAGQMPLRILATAFPPAHVRCSADGRRLFAWGEKMEQPFAAWGPPGGVAPFSPPPGGTVRDAALDANGRRAAVISGEAEVTVWDLDRGAVLSNIRSASGPIAQVLLTPDGGRVLLVSRTGAAQIFSSVTGRPLARPQAQASGFTSVTLDASGARLLTAGRDSTARLWDVFTGEPLSPPIPQPGAIEHVALAPIGDRALLLTRGSGARHLQGWQLHVRAESTGASPSAVPSWFPEFLEAMAGGSQLPAFRERAKSLGDSEFYAAWVRRYLGLAKR